MAEIKTSTVLLELEFPKCSKECVNNANGVVNQLNPGLLHCLECIFDFGDVQGIKSHRSISKYSKRLCKDPEQLKGINGIKMH